MLYILFFKYPQFLLSGVNSYRATVGSYIPPSADSVNRIKCALCFWVEKSLIVLTTVWHLVESSWDLSVKVFFYQEVELNSKYANWQLIGESDKCWRWSEVEIFVYASWQQMQVSCIRESKQSFLPYLDPECIWHERPGASRQIHK